MQRGSTVHIWKDSGKWIFRRRRHWMIDLSEVQYIHKPRFRRMKVVFRNRRVARVPKVIGEALDQLLKRLDYY